MRIIRGVEFQAGSREEKLPGFTKEFPYISSCTVFDQDGADFIPWHWHKSVELFYIRKGSIEYSTPSGNYIFSEGSGGFINSNILHMTRAKSERVEQLLHIFDASFISGGRGSQIEEKYILPMLTSQQLDVIRFDPEQTEHKEILDSIKKAFDYSEQEYGYEIQMRDELSKIWLSILKMADSIEIRNKKRDYADDKVKLMMVYVHENYQEKITISKLADAGYMSERECFRVFQQCLHMTPTEYITNYRLQSACYMLANEKKSITEVSHACGLGSSSYFGKVFRENIEITPMEYRQKWQNNDI